MRMLRKYIFLVKSFLLLFLFVVHFEPVYSQEVIKEDRVLQLFRGVEVAKDVNVIIVQGDTLSVRVETDEQLLRAVITEVSGDVLKLAIDERKRSLMAKKSSAIVYISLPELTSVSVSLGSVVSLQSEFTTDNLELTATFGGQIHIDKEITIEHKLGLNVKTKGKILSKGNIITDTANLTVASSGEVHLPLEVKGKIECTAMDSSLITISGKAHDALISAMSKSELKMKQFKVQNANIVATSSAIIQITVEEFLAATAADRSIITYSGKPKTVSKETTSGGKIK